MQNGIKFNLKDDVNTKEENKKHSDDENDNLNTLPLQENVIQEEESSNVNEHKRAEPTIHESSS